MWAVITIWVHEIGHALWAHFFGLPVYKVEVGIGHPLVKFSQIGSLKFKTVFRLLPIAGLTTHGPTISTASEIIILAVGVITEFILTYLIYSLVKRKIKKGNGNRIDFLLYYYVIKIVFWLSFLCNCVPFLLAESDYTKIVKILLGW